ncbi:MAG: uncharacterized protein K0S61_2736 [Anaerocolumna sp.]|nr:uncharacterized protein [Anaerocolumna sp.]
MSKKIKYIAFYEEAATNKQNRYAVLAAVNKINYINNTLVRNDYEVTIISPTWTLNNSGFYKGGTRSVAPNIKLKTFHTFGSSIKVFRMFKYLFSLLQLFFYLIVHTVKDEPIIVYHSVILSFPVRLAKCIKRFSIILEVEEIYQDVMSFSNYMKASEYKIFHKADKYIFSTELLHKKLNDKNKPYAIVYGVYHNEELIAKKEKDGYIHVVYAGTFSPKKGGGLAAVGCAAYLPKEYHVHIIGFGSEEETMSIKEKIKEIGDKSQAKITFDGTLSGKDYITFLQKCHIGLSTQNPRAVFCETSFPSKVLSYLSNGLWVVSGRIKVVELTKLSSIYYYDKQTSKSIAKAILSVNLNAPNNCREIMKSLDDNFIKEIALLVKK